MQVEKRVPELRFRGFSGEWEWKSLGDIGSIGMNKRVFKNQTSEKGDIPFFKIGTFGGKANAFIHRDLFEEYKSKYPYPEKGALLISASGSIGKIVEYTGKDEYYQDSNIVWLMHSNKIENSFLKQFYKIVKWHGLEGSTIQRLYNKNILETYIGLPKKNEQIKIGNYFQNLDKFIKQKEKKYQKLGQLKKAMLEKMFPKEGATIPEIRFKGFRGEWEEFILNDLCSIITKQTGFDYSATIKPSLSTVYSDNSYSFIQNKDFNGININLNTTFYIPKKIANKFDKILIDKPSILISISGKIGNVGLYKLAQKSFIGGAVGICKLIDDTNGLVILHNLLSKNGQNYFKSLIKASSHSNITVYDIRKIKVKIPHESIEKEKIGNYFQKLDHLIDLQHQELQKLKNIKKASLAKMFV